MAVELGDLAPAILTDSVYLCALDSDDDIFMFVKINAQHPDIRNTQEHHDEFARFEAHYV